MARHDFTVLAVETSDSGTDKAMYRWCRRCGVVRITCTPEWDDSATYLLPGDYSRLEGGSRWGRREAPACQKSPTSGES